jgi:hypothetical protein
VIRAEPPPWVIARGSWHYKVTLNNYEYDSNKGHMIPGDVTPYQPLSPQLLVNHRRIQANLAVLREAGAVLNDGELRFMPPELVETITSMVLRDPVEFMGTGHYLSWCVQRDVWTVCDLCGKRTEPVYTSGRKCLKCSQERRACADCNHKHRHQYQNVLIYRECFWCWMDPTPTVVFTGSRTWENRRLVQYLLEQIPPHYTIVHGHCPHGLDHIVHALLDEMPAYRELAFPVSATEWRRLGKRAGPMRNERMLDMVDHTGRSLPNLLPPSVVYAFLNASKESDSPGTRQTIAAAERRGIRVVQFKHRDFGEQLSDLPATRSAAVRAASALIESNKIETN